MDVVDTTKQKLTVYEIANEELDYLNQIYMAR